MNLPGALFRSSIGRKYLMAATGRGSKGATVAVRYRHPDDANLQWTGRGRQPKWVVEALGKGKSLDDLRI